jgi:adenylylsulfate kinase
LPPRVIECVCADAVARERLERDRRRGDHPAGNRGFELYLARKAAAEPLTVPRLMIDTGTLTPEEAVARCLDYLREG